MRIEMFAALVQTIQFSLVNHSVAAIMTTEASQVWLQVHSRRADYGTGRDTQ